MAPLGLRDRGVRHEWLEPTVDRGRYRRPGPESLAAGGFSRSPTRAQAGVLPFRQSRCLSGLRGSRHWAMSRAVVWSMAAMSQARFSLVAGSLALGAAGYNYAGGEVWSIDRDRTPDLACPVDSPEACPHLRPACVRTPCLCPGRGHDDHGGYRR